MRKLILCMGLVALLAGVLQAADKTVGVAEGREPKDREELQYWLANMAVHQFTTEEVGLALGVSATDAHSLIEKSISSLPTVEKSIGAPGAGKVMILPYPGGRHPRIGFLEGAIHPQRETKVSIFTPWKDGGYIVVDLPEAVWHQKDGKRQLLYLAHTHVATIWDQQNIRLPQLEWKRQAQDDLILTRELPNKVVMSSRVKISDGGVRLQFSITNGSTDKLTELHIQMCGMLKSLTGFSELTNDNKVFSSPFSACRNSPGNRWVILGFDHCIRAWGNSRCPCLHADPQVPDCAPVETQTVHGWVSFFEGEDIASELQRLKEFAFQSIEKQ